MPRDPRRPDPPMEVIDRWEREGRAEALRLLAEAGSAERPIYFSFKMFSDYARCTDTSMRQSISFFRRAEWALDTYRLITSAVCPHAVDISPYVDSGAWQSVIFTTLDRDYRVSPDFHGRGLFAVSHGEVRFSDRNTAILFRLAL